LNFVYKSIIKPKLEYGCTLWGHTYDTHLSNLFKVQKKVCEDYIDSNPSAHSFPLFKRLNWKPLENSIKYESILYIYKAINGFGSRFSTEMFELNTNRTSGRSGVIVTDCI